MCLFTLLYKSYLPCYSDHILYYYKYQYTSTNKYKALSIDEFIILFNTKKFDNVNEIVELYNNYKKTDNIIILNMPYILKSKKIPNEYIAVIFNIINYC